MTYEAIRRHLDDFGALPAQVEEIDTRRPVVRRSPDADGCPVTERLTYGEPLT